MLKIENLSYSFPQKDLFDKISFTLEERQHCALIGASGSGKSTLIDIIINPDKYMFDGKAYLTGDYRVGYVSQFTLPEKKSSVTVFEYIGEEFIRLQKEISSICSEMETASDIEPLLDKYQQVLDAFQAIDGDDYESNIAKKLHLAGLNGQEGLPVSNLSDGEFKLIQIMREMLISPHLLIMDEPDAFLDFDHLNSLKNLINTHKGTLLVITHNRYLLNHCFNKIIHLENKLLQEFDGRYLDYSFSLLKRKVELQELAIADMEEIERNEAMVDNLRTAATIYTNASRGRALNARVTMLERLKARSVKEPFVDIKQPEIYFSTDRIPEDDVILSVRQYCVGYDTMLLENADFELKSTDKVALIGPNGSGKTTLLREIFRNTHPSIKISEDVQMAFLSQLSGETLKESHTILEEFFDAGFDTSQSICDYLSDYGFEPEIMNQKISSLSGGEKNILQLAKLTLGNANLLLLDEPTSHLDTYSQMALEKAVKEYNGAVLMISHDFFTIANCMDYVLIIEDKSIRKMSMRKFRKTIYARHFDRDYLDMEQKKKEIETNVSLALKEKDFTLAKAILDRI